MTGRMALGKDAAEELRVDADARCSTRSYWPVGLFGSRASCFRGAELLLHLRQRLVEHAKVLVHSSYPPLHHESLCHLWWKGGSVVALNGRFPRHLVQLLRRPGLESAVRW